MKYLVLSLMLIGLIGCAEQVKNMEEAEAKALEEAKVKCFESGGVELHYGSSGGSSNHNVCIYKSCSDSCFILEEK